MDLSQILATWPVLGSNVTSLGDVGRATHLRGSSGHYFLKRRASAEHAAREAGVLAHLRDQGLPVPEPVRTGRGEPFAASSAGRDVTCLYRALPGRHYESFDGKEGVIRARQVGKALGRLHVALAEVPSMVGFDRYGPEALLASELRAAGDVYDSERLGRIAARRSPSRELPEQLIHRDFHLYNLLFCDGRPSGYLDFDMLMRGPRLFDLCYCSIETLAKRFDEPAFPDADPIPGKNAERVLHWLDERRHLIQSVVQSV
jgi:Ser/Thr protein kinase RdoA (MazF antagonist)